MLVHALLFWNIFFSPSDFETTSGRNCQCLTQPVRNCQHADPYQVLGLERSEQQWMSPRVNPGGIAKQLSPGWKSISVSVPDVKRSNVVRLKTPLRCNFFWTEHIVVYAIDSKFWGEFYLSDLPPTILNIFQIWATFILRTSPNFLLQSFPALIFSGELRG